MNNLPGYWMNETSGVLAPVVMAYLNHEKLDLHQLAIMRGYLRQWIEAPGWFGDEVEDLRKTVDDIATTHDVDEWLNRAAACNIDPL